MFCLLIQPERWKWASPLKNVTASWGRVSRTCSFVGHEIAVSQLLHNSQFIRMKLEFVVKDSSHSSVRKPQSSRMFASRTAGGGGGAAKMTFSLSTFSGVLAVLTAPNMRLTTLPVSWIAVTHERIEFRPGIGLRGGILKRARKARLVATMERPILKYASTANARCSLIQNMIGTGCGGTKIDDLPSRTHPLLAPYLHPLPFGGFFKNVSFSTAPCMWFCEYTYAYLNVSIARIRTV